MKNAILIFMGIAVALSACAKKDYLVTIHTSYGDIKVLLYDQTPQHKDNFIKLASNGDYDSTTFHRVIQNFMIQGGDVNAKPGNKNKIDYTIPAEFVDTLFHRRGALAAARLGDDVNPKKASSGCQWYIVQGNVMSKEELTTDTQKLGTTLMELLQQPEYDSLREALSNIFYKEGQEAYGKKVMELKPFLEQKLNMSFDIKYPKNRLEVYTTEGGAPHLDDAYTVFGQVVEGMDVVDKIAAVKTGQMDKPMDDIYITMDVEQLNVKKLQKMYGMR